MKYIYTNKAIKEIKKLQQDAHKKIINLQVEIENATTIKDIINIAPIKNHVGLYRIKRTPYRVIVRLEGNTLVILSVSKRNEGTYKNL